MFVDILHLLDNTFLDRFEYSFKIQAIVNYIVSVREQLSDLKLTHTRICDTNQWSPNQVLPCNRLQMLENLHKSEQRV